MASTPTSDGLKYLFTALQESCTTSVNMILEDPEKRRPLMTQDASGTTSEVLRQLVEENTNIDCVAKGHRDLVNTVLLASITFSSLVSVYRSLNCIDEYPTTSKSPPSSNDVHSYSIYPSSLAPASRSQLQNPALFRNKKLLGTSALLLGVVEEAIRNPCDTLQTPHSTCLRIGAALLGPWSVDTAPMRESDPARCPDVRRGSTSEAVRHRRVWHKALATRSY